MDFNYKDLLDEKLIKKITIPQLKKKANELNIYYKSNIKKQDLVNLLLEKIEKDIPNKDEIKEEIKSEEVGEKESVELFFKKFENDKKKESIKEELKKIPISKTKGKVESELINYLIAWIDSENFQTKKIYHKNYTSKFLGQVHEICRKGYITTMDEKDENEDHFMVEIFDQNTIYKTPNEI